MGNEKQEQKTEALSLEEARALRAVQRSICGDQMRVPVIPIRGKIRTDTCTISSASKYVEFSL